MAGAFALALSPLSGAEAATFGGSTSFFGDVCDLDTDGVSGFDDCRTVEQPGSGNPQGVFSLTLDGLNPNATTAATVEITVEDADLFTPSGANNRIEFFALSLDDQFFGVLFDRSTSNERAINESLGASVEANIDAATASTGPIALSFQIPLDEFAPLIADGSLTAFFDFRDDQDIGNFLNPVFSVSYAVPLPASMLLLLSGFAGLAYVGRRKTAAA